MSKSSAFKFKNRPQPQGEPRAIYCVWYFCPQCAGSNLFDEVFAYVQLGELGGVLTDVKRIAVQRCRGCGWVGDIVQQGIRQTRNEREKVLHAVAVNEVDGRMQWLYWEAEA